MATLKVTVNGTTYTLPDPVLEGMGMSDSKIWSSNSGRDSQGSFAGTLIGIKAKVELSWPVMSFSDAAIIKTAANKKVETCTLSYTDIDGAKTITGYFGDLSYTIVDYGRQWVKNMKVSIIEV